ncbi:hypothetical protein D3C72_1236690 [compost metagenome]
MKNQDIQFLKETVLFAILCEMEIIIYGEILNKKLSKRLGICLKRLWLSQDYDRMILLNH